MREVPAPRLTHGGETEHALHALLLCLQETHAVVNCAGIPDATTNKYSQLRAANVELPGLLASAAEKLSIRFIHVSSAAVQGRVEILDDSRATRPFSAYSRSKADGESAALNRSGCTVIYRPPGVHHESREVTQKLAKLARSCASSVAGAGNRPSAQALIENVADAVAFLATCEQDPPAIVHHPSEGLTTSSILEDLSGKVPRSLPDSLAGAFVRAAFATGRLHPGMIGHARRAEMLWFGQSQAPSWLTAAGWRPTVGRERWREIGFELRREHLLKKEHTA